MFGCARRSPACRSQSVKGPLRRVYMPRLLVKGPLEREEDLKELRGHVDLCLLSLKLTYNTTSKYLLSKLREYGSLPPAVGP